MLKNTPLKALGAFVISVVLSGCAISQVGRLAVPEASGLTCFPNGICVENPARKDEATALSDDAMSFVQRKFGPLKVAPRMLFCETRTCTTKFGSPDVAALYFLGTNRIVVGETGWVKFILRHEMIHHWQVETFGALRVDRKLPRWYIEGMAYELSNDPRKSVLNEEADKQRLQFRAWVAAGNNWRVPPA